jgi:hypothetical protein
MINARRRFFAAAKSRIYDVKFGGSDALSGVRALQ